MCWYVLEDKTKKFKLIKYCNFKTIENDHQEVIFLSVSILVFQGQDILTNDEDNSYISLNTWCLKVE